MDMRTNEILKRLTSSRTNLTMIVLAILIIFFGSYAITGYLVSDGSPDTPDNSGSEPVEIQTFTDTGGEIELQDGKPVIRLFSTTWCGHCNWIRDTYDSVVQEYVDRGDIVAYHWDLDAQDDTLTPEVEGEIPASELAVYREFNPRGSIPTFVFGSRYVRVGNGFERTGTLADEEAEFRAVIDTLIADSA